MKNLTGKGKPFHSALDKGAALLKRKVGTGAEFMQELKGLGGIKQAEVDERKLAELMGLPKMTHEQFMAELANRPVPAIGEKVLSNPTGDDVNAAAKAQILDMERAQLKEQGMSAKEIEQELEGHAERVQKNNPKAWDRVWNDTYTAMNQDPTHHDKYTLPGGENYREMLIKSPRERGVDQFEGVGAHFGGEPGILASLRLKDRIGPNGEKLLHLEELQSDWHQQGRDKGYRSDYGTESDMLKKRDELYDARTELVRQALEIEKRDGLIPEEMQTQINALNDQLRTVEESKDKARIAVPDAPFKKSWEEMALKRLIHHAAEKGYHGIVVTPGEEQADRYSLAKHIDDLHYSGSNLVAYDPDGNEVIKRTGVRPQDLPELVGKELSEKLMAQEPKGTLRSLSGVDLKVGGEGMKGFYDKKVPNILNTIGKKYGVKTQLHGHQLKISDDLNFPPNNNNLPQHVPGETRAVHHFPITEDMRKDITANGLPLYKEGGNVKAKTTEDMRNELLQRHTKGERLSKADNEALGLYHRVGGGKKLKKPVSEYQFDLENDPKIQMAPEKLITPEDLYGGYGIPFIGDSSMAGKLLTGAEGKKFEQPVELSGGHDYMRAQQHDDPAKRAIWASAQGKISHLTKKAKRVSDDGSPVYGIHTSMSPTGVDFSNMPAAALAELVKTAKIKKRDIDAFNKEMRAEHPDFPGLTHKELHDMLTAPGAGNLRKHFVERMATDIYQNAGFPEIAMARLATQHKNLMEHDTPGQEFVGSSIGKFRPDFGQVDDPVHPHPSYPSVIGGDYMGALHPSTGKPLLNTKEFFPEFHKMRREFGAQEAGDRRSFELAQPVQKFDQEWLDKVMPVYLKRRKETMGYADGGNVRLSLDQMKTALNKKAKPDFNDMRSVGVNEAPALDIKAFIPPARDSQGTFPVGGVTMGGQPLPMGGVDMNKGQPGNQLMPANMAQPAPQDGQPPQGMPSPLGGAGGPPPQGGSNILQMTPQGQAMAAMKPQGMAQGGIATLGQMTGAANSPSVPQMAMGGSENNLPVIQKDPSSAVASPSNQNMDNGATNYSIDSFVPMMAEGGEVGGSALMDVFRAHYDKLFSGKDAAPQFHEWLLSLKKPAGRKVKMHDDMDTINLELSNKRKKAK